MWIEARIDGRDELHLGPRRADWLHLAWSWPTDVRLGGLAWDPQGAPLDAPPDALFFSPNLDLERVKLKVEQGRGEVQLQASGGRLFLEFDDGEHLGAEEYRVQLRFPKPPRSVKTELPTGPALLVEVVHAPAADVAGAPLNILALSPATGEYVSWPGLRGLDGSGRCRVALPSGTYRFEVLHAPAQDRLVALRTGPVRVTRARTVDLEATTASPLTWKHGDLELELHSVALRSMLSSRAIAWERTEGAGELELVVSPQEEFDLRAFGGRDTTQVAWWARRKLGDDVQIDSTRQAWIRCGFRGHDRAPLPADCEGRLHSARSRFDFPIVAETELLTNRRFLGFSYRHSIPGGGRAVFHPRQVLLPKSGARYSFELGGDLSGSGSVALLQNENLGSPDALELWWELQMTSAAGDRLDTAASDIEWTARASFADGSALPSAPVDEEGLRVLGDPDETVVLNASYRWNGTREVRVKPVAQRSLENGLYRSSVPGHLEPRARAYLDKARRAYRAIEAARGKPGTHDSPIELKWWLNGGAVGVWGSITMPIAGMTDDDDWYSFPWALAHESLHAFGYHHGAELDRIDREAQAIFEAACWVAEFDPGSIPPSW